MDAHPPEHSNFTQAFPSYLSSCDWTGLKTSKGLPELWSGQSITFQPATDKIDQTIHHFFFEQDQQRKGKFQEYLALGFPILFQPGPAGMQAIPVLIWPMRLSAPFREKDAWTIASTPDSRPILNPEIQPQFPLPALAPRIKPLMKVLAQLLQATPAPLSSQDWQAFPDQSIRSFDDPSALLYPTAVLALFPQQVYPNSSLPRLECPPFEKNDITWQHSICPQNLDPSQQAVINHFYESESCLVSGPVGSGKTRLSQNLMVNALSNQKKTLFVSRRPDRLSQIQAYLEQLGLGHLSFWLRQPAHDADLLPQLLQAPIQPTRNWSEQSLRNWLHQAAAWQQYKNRQDKAISAARTPVFGSLNWAQTLGRYLEYGERNTQPLPGIQVPSQSFNFTHQEFNELAATLQQAQISYQNVGNLRHPLHALHPHLFTQYHTEQAKRFVDTQIPSYLQKLLTLQQQYSDLLQQYEHRLKTDFEQYYRTNKENISRLLEFFSININIYGKKFLSFNTTSLPLFASLSKELKAMQVARGKAIKQIQHLYQSIAPIPELDCPPFPKTGSPFTLLHNWLFDWQTALDNWYRQIPDLLQDHLRRLNYSSSYPSLGLQTAILELETSLDQTIEAINQSGLLSRSLTQPMLTLLRRQQHIETLIEYFEQLHAKLPDFTSYYPWQRFWLQQPEAIQQLILAIIRSKASDWQLSFQCWYLQQLLRVRQSPYLPEADGSNPQQIENLITLRLQLGAQINYQWAQKRQEASRTFRKLKARPASMDGLAYLQSLLANTGQSVTSVIPLLLASPELALTLLQQTRKPLFDLLILDDATSIDAATGQFLKQLARQCLLIADDTLPTALETSSIFHFYRQQKQPVFQLAYLHRYYPGHLWQHFRGQPRTESSIDSQRIQVQFVESTYLPATGTNPTEAQYVLAYLQDRKHNQHRTYPDLAIVVSTVEQRNLILKGLLQLKRTGPDAIRENIAQMERNGLMVLHLEELTGHRFDELLFSFTFTAPSGSTKLPDRASLLNRPEGLQQLYHLLGTGKTDVHIVHSLPDSWLNQPISQAQQPGYWLLVHYLRLLRAMQDGDAPLQHSITKQVAQQLQADRAAKDSELLYDVIARRLGYFLPEAQILRNYQFVDFHFPLLVRHDAYPENLLAIQVDYFIANQVASQMVWETKIRQRYASHGVICLSTWSLHWWQDPDRAAQALAQLILETWKTKK